MFTSVILAKVCIVHGLYPIFPPSTEKCAGGGQVNAIKAMSTKVFIIDPLAA
ncbi:MAG TPA: hypothetical protein VHO70_14000 [Chitinispirillaceae bacterium]|nr:hypothetical protein [Chitinispirillaceae bacterium]